MTTPAGPTDSSATTGGLSAGARALLERRAQRGGSGQIRGTIERRPDSSGAAPLSSWQQSIWFLDQMEPGRDMYNRPSRLRLQGPLNTDALAKSVSEIFRRHEVLRSRVAMEDGNPVQEVMEDFEFSLTEIDLTSLPPAERELRYAELTAEQARAPFDLAAGPFARAVLIRLDSNVHVLAFTAHHIAFDGWSSGIFYSELADLYGQFDSSQLVPSDDLQFQYADFAVWQRARIESSALDADLQYWEKQMAGAPPLLELPADNPRQLTSGHTARRASMVLGPIIIEQLRALGREENATLFMSLFAAFQLLLSRLSGQSGQRDVVVGVPVADRTDAATEKLLGCFINVLPMRTQIDYDRSFREMLRDVRRTRLDGYEHQEVPFDVIVERLQPERNLAYAPLTQVLFNYRNTPPPRVAFPGLQADIESAIPTSLISDFEFEIAHGPGGLHCAAIYNADLFDESTVERWLGHYRTLLESIIASPDQRVGGLALLSPSEVRRITVDWNSAATAPDYETCLHRLIEAQVRRTPNATAVFDETSSLTYEELNQRANHVARDLAARGVCADVLVGISMERCPDMVVALLGVLKAGGAYVPLDPEYPLDRLNYMLSDSRPAVLLSQPRIAERLDAGSTLVINIDARYWNVAPMTDGGNLESDATPDSLAYVIYTSGSTGRPKGAMNTHRAVCNVILRARDTVGCSDSDIVLLRTPLSFDLSVKELFMPLIAGGRVALARVNDSADPEYLARAIESYGATILCDVPTVLQIVLDVPDVSRMCASVRAVVTGGETLSNALLHKHFELLDADIYNTCGPTETAIDATVWKCERVSKHRSVPIGRPLINSQIYILDSDGEPVPVGVTGEIYIGGVGVGRGYLNRPELTAEKFLPDRFRTTPGATIYRSGDLGRFDEDGVIEILGRVDHQVKVRGVRIELGEIESVLASVDGVRENVVVVRDDAPGGPRLVAYLVADGSRDLSERALREALGAKLLPAMVPSAFVFLGALPLTPSRKVDRSALPAPVVRESVKDDSPPIPRTPREELVAAVWADVLKKDSIGVEDNFFELGGHSLHATQVMSRLRDRCGLDLPLKMLFEYPVVGSLAAAIDDVVLSTHSEEYLNLLLDEIQADTIVPDRDLG